MIKNFEIVKYKCFKNFKLEGLSRINIITGDNNVGKTALLEAVSLFNIDTSYSIVDGLPISRAISSRDMLISKDVFEYQLEKFSFIALSEDKKTSIEFKFPFQFSKAEKDEALKLNAMTAQIVVTKNDTILFGLPSVLDYDYTYEEYIDSSKPTNYRLVQLYSGIQSKRIQHKFLEYLQLFDSNIVWIEPQLIKKEVYLLINLKKPEISLLSSELGEGTNRFIEILATILTAKDKIVFIDEIENGIYYNKFKDIWKAIIEIAQQEGVQLFVTTHNEDTIEALKEASEEVGFEDIASIELYKKDGVIHPIIRNYESFNASVDAGMDIR